MKKILVLASALMATTSMTAYSMEAPMHEAPFAGINTVMEKCHIISENEFMYKGAAKTKLTINKNYILASCTAKYLEVKEAPVQNEGRVSEIPCIIAVEEDEAVIKYSGVGGFTVSQGGVVTANCKVDKNL